MKHTGGPLAHDDVTFMAIKILSAYGRAAGWRWRGEEKRTRLDSANR
jgi:hypothetical protein